MVLLGPSGSGKSTSSTASATSTPRAAARPQISTTGKTRRRGHAISARTYVRLRVPVLQPDPEPHGGGDIALVTEISANPMQPEDALRLVRARRASAPLSRTALRGEQQRVTRSRDAIANDRTSALRRADGRARQPDRDPRARGHRAHPRQLGTSTVLITHNAVIADMADRDAGHGRRQRPRKSGATHRRPRGNSRGDEALHRKLLRDLWRLRDRVFIIALVMASGHRCARHVARGGVPSRRPPSYCERYGFAQVFAHVERA